MGNRPKEDFKTVAQSIDWTYSYSSDPAAQWLFDRVRSYGLDVVTDFNQNRPVRVDLVKGLLKVRPDMEFPLLHWWISRAIALTQLGPDLIPDLIPVRRASQVVVPLLRRPW